MADCCWLLMKIIVDCVYVGLLLLGVVHLVIGRKEKLFWTVVDVVAVGLPIVQIALSIYTDSLLTDAFQVFTTETATTRGDIIDASQLMNTAINYSLWTRSVSMGVMISYLLSFFKALALHPRLSFLSETMVCAMQLQTTEPPHTFSCVSTMRLRRVCLENPTGICLHN